MSDYRLKPVLHVLGALVVLGFMVSFFGRELESHIESLESWIRQFGLLGGLIFIGLVVIGTSLLLPESLFGVIAGVLFGLAWGVAIMLLARVMAAVVQYGLAYRLLREPIQRKLGTGKLSIAVRNAAISGNIRLQLLLRLTPLNQASISYLLGASGVRFPPFLIASVAMLPLIIVEVYLGRAGKHLALVSANSGQAGWLHGLLLFAGLLAAVIGVGLASRFAYRRFLHDADTFAHNPRENNEQPAIKP